jgi:transcriptional regulator with XRE-family HTH domain
MLVTSADILRIARHRAGLTQAELAARTGHPRESIARWEAGGNDPSFETLGRLVRGCGLDLVPTLARADDSYSDNIARQLELSPRERLESLLPEPLAERCISALRLIAGLRTPVIVTGTVGAALLGGPQRPGDGNVEIVPDRAHAARLVEELLDAGASPEPVQSTGDRIHVRTPWKLRHGAQLTEIATPAGTRGYRDLRRQAILVTLQPASQVLVAHPRDLLRIAEASPWPDDTSHRSAYRALLETRSERPAA